MLHRRNSITLDILRLVPGEGSREERSPAMKPEPGSVPPIERVMWIRPNGRSLGKNVEQFRRFMEAWTEKGFPTTRIEFVTPEILDLQNALQRANAEVVAAQRAFAANVLIPNEEYVAQCKRVIKLETALREIANDAPTNTNSIAVRIARAALAPSEMSEAPATTQLVRGRESDQVGDEQVAACSAGIDRCKAISRKDL